MNHQQALDAIKEHLSRLEACAKSNIGNIYHHACGMAEMAYRMNTIRFEEYVSVGNVLSETYHKRYRER